MQSGVVAGSAVVVVEVALDMVVMAFVQGQARRLRDIGRRAAFGAGSRLARIESNWVSDQA